MGFVAGVWILTFGVLFLLVMITNPPWEVLQAPPASEATFAPAPTNATAPAAPTEPEATPPASTDDMLTPAPATPPSAPEPARPDELTPPAPVDAPTMTPPPAQTQTPADLEIERRERIIQAWVGHAWPLLLLGFLLIVAVTLWLQGGEMGYLAKQVTGQPVRIAEFWVTGTRAIGALLASSLLSLLFTLGVVLITVFVFWVLSFLPRTLALILGVVFLAALGAGLVWLLVRLLFWLIAIVVDRRGPIAGLRASVRVTRGHWWKVFGLFALFLVVFMAVGLVFTVVDWLAGLVGGTAGVVIAQVGAVLQLVITNLYLAFVTTAALIRFYDDLKASTASSSAQPVPVS